MKESPTKVPNQVRHSQRQIRAFLKAHPSSGQSRVFAAENGIGLSTLTRWQRLYRKRPQRIEVQAPSAGLGSSPIASIQFADGLTIQLQPGFPAGSVAELVQHLRKP